MHSFIHAPLGLFVGLSAPMFDPVILHSLHADGTRLGGVQDAGKPVDEAVLNSVTMDSLAAEIRRRGGTPGRYFL